MLARLFSCAILGLDGVLVEVKVDTSPGLPKIITVGLPDAAVQGPAERKHSVIKNSGLYFPSKHITFNLALASVRKSCQLTEEAALLKNAISPLRLAAQAYHRTLKRGRTIPKLAAEPVIGTAHLAKAPQHSARVEVMV